MIKKILQSHEITPDPELGQNFMAKSETIRKIVSLAGPKPDETVLEIGAGLGFLTEELAKKAGRVIAVEIDRGLASIAKKELEDYSNVEVVRANILKSIGQFECDVVVSNLPYAISEALLRKLAVFGFNQAVLVVPKGFAYRLTAHEGSGNYTKMSVFAHEFFDIEIKAELSKEDFYPQPNTNSVVINLRKKPETPGQILFLQERKKTKNILLRVLERHWKMTKNQAREALKSLKINNKTLEKRAKDIDLKEIKTIINALKELKKRKYHHNQTGNA